MNIKVKGAGRRTLRTAGNPIRMSGYVGNNVVDPVCAPKLDQHREAILAEFMARHDAYAPAKGADDALEDQDDESSTGSSIQLTTAS